MSLCNVTNVTLYSLQPKHSGPRPVWALLRAVLQWTGLGCGMWLVAGDAAANVCSRTGQVRDAIVAASGKENCAQISNRDLQEITALDLSNQDVTHLRPTDFDGLVRLESLDLSGNLLTSLPEDIFDELYMLGSLHLDGNELTTLRSDVFTELFFLDDLTLHDNRLTALPPGFFDEFSRFDGMQPNGAPPDNSGDYPRIQRFLDRHSVTSPEEFIAALPAPHKQHFVMVYESEAAARAHVSPDHPRIASWGAEGDFIFAWNTDPDAPIGFRETVEFLRQNETAWTAGIIDFSGADPEISEPASCQSCHGPLNKPLWGMYNRWPGSEHDRKRRRNAAMEAILASSDPRIEPLDFPEGAFRHGYKGVRYLPLTETTAVEEAGAVWSWRHAEVLFAILKEREQNFASWAGNAVCNGWDLPVRFFSQSEQNLFLRANREDVVIEDGVIVGGLEDEASHGVHTFIERSYWYTDQANVADAMMFLTLAELWKSEPLVRRLYRRTGNAATVDAGVHPEIRESMLYYPSGTATAEEELIQKLRFHFGRGGERALDLRREQNDRFTPGGFLSATFRAGHLGVMGPRTCRALTESVPRNLSVTLDGTSPSLQWEAPTYDSGSITGYRIRRGLGDAEPVVLIADTGSRETSWTDEDAPAGQIVYAVQTIYDRYYVGPGSERAEITLAQQDPALAWSTSLTIGVSSDGHRGYSSLPNPDLGSVEGDRFRYGPTSGPIYQMQFLLAHSGGVLFRVRNHGEALSGLVLEWAGETLPLNAATRDGNQFAWGPDWLSANAPSLHPSSQTTTLPAAGVGVVCLRSAQETCPATTITEIAPLKATVEELPESHDGASVFTFVLRFSEEFPLSFRTLRDQSFQVTAATIRRAKRLRRGSNRGWRIHVRPDADAEVVLILAPDRACEAAGAICTTDGRRLSNRLELRVPGPE